LNARETNDERGETFHALALPNRARLLQAYDIRLSRSIDLFLVGGQ
jgi:hypothetical protein